MIGLGTFYNALGSYLVGFRTAHQSTFVRRFSLETLLKVTAGVAVFVLNLGDLGKDAGEFMEVM